MFRTVPLSVIRSFSLYTQQRYMSYRSADSLRAGSGRLSHFLMTFTLLHFVFFALLGLSDPYSGDKGATT